MDNDLGIIKIAKRVIKKIHFQLVYRKIVILNEEDGNSAIASMLMERKPFVAIRGGATELRCINEYLTKKNSFSDKIKKEILELSGVFPATDSLLERFSEYYIECLKKGDLIALWDVGAEYKLVPSCEKSRFIKLRSLEPYYFSNPWSKCLAGKRVLIIHPFVESIKNQYEIRERLFSNNEVLPEFEKLILLKAIQSSAGEKVVYNDWVEALDYMKKQISKIEFDVAIIGAGAYGLPLAVYCKELGKQAIQMSGATQLLFGIKGKRWDNHKAISKLYNDYWVKPLVDETPEHNSLVEGGCYW